eukprot:TRINITY_DN8564_c0_g1_i1.p1 TRINITY_DN8564_c0_g1~~TRINITY_DN8564_c0_g1_i1.p1  ORF type:complete len:452 (-),score=71.12 TRINITY_DN8564_c0_g1_i1:1349-2704(-)
MGAKGSKGHQPPSSKGVSIVLPNGDVRFYPHSVTAVQVMEDVPGYFLSASCTRPKACGTEQANLAGGNIYFLYPLQESHSSRLPSWGQQKPPRVVSVPCMHGLRKVWSDDTAPPYKPTKTSSGSRRRSCEVPLPNSRPSRNSATSISSPSVLFHSSPRIASRRVHTAPEASVVEEAVCAENMRSPLSVILCPSPASTDDSFDGMAACRKISWSSVESVADQEQAAEEREEGRRQSHGGPECEKEVREDGVMQEACDMDRKGGTGKDGAEVNSFRGVRLDAGSLGDAAPFTSPALTVSDAPPCANSAAKRNSEMGVHRASEDRRVPPVPAAHSDDSFYKYASGVLQSQVTASENWLADKQAYAPASVKVLGEMAVVSRTSSVRWRPSLEVLAEANVRPRQQAEGEWTESLQHLGGRAKMRLRRRSLELPRDFNVEALHEAGAAVERVSECRF